MTVAWHRAREPLTVLAAIVIVALTSQRWAGFDTPDSSFYASLSLFGDEVSDRAPDNSYYWTRLGYIVPVRILTHILGPWAGFFAWRLLLISVIVASIYLIARRFTGIPSAAFLACIASLSSVMLSNLGNTYLTGTVLAGTAALVACAMFDGKRAAIAAGVVLGWLVMVNPPGVLLAGTLWLAVRIHATAQRRQWRQSLIGLVLAAVATIVVFGLFLAALGTILWVLGAIVFNLIADLVGGVRVTVLEEELTSVEGDKKRR